MLLLAFVAVEARAQQPVVPLRIFRLRTLSGANLVTLALACAANTPIYFLSLYLQQVRGMSALETGLVFVPCNLAVLGGSALATPLTNRLGYRVGTVLGMGVLALGTALLAGLYANAGYVGSVLPGLLAFGLGLGIAQVTASNAATAPVGPQERGLATGLFNTSMEIGTAIGLAILVSISTARSAALAASGLAATDALVEGFRWAFGAGTALALVGALAAWIIIRPRAQAAATSP
jgi:MFS family permease